jgi:hypothetical protein
MQGMKKRGGKRAGAGRPIGTTRGRNTVTRSISLPPETWQAIDAARGSAPRGKWIAARIGLPPADG